MRELSTVSGALLEPRLRTSPTAPAITYYDDATGERIELSAVTLANWAAKTGNLLRDELGAGPGSRVAVLLPAHWQTAGVLLGIWYIGAEAVVGHSDWRTDCDVACTTMARLDEADTAVVPMGEVVALSLDPFGKPVPDLPVGITDYATSVRVHGDQIAAEPNPGPALAGRSVADTLAAAESAAGARGLTAGDRVLSTTDWDSADAVVDHLLAVFASGGSLVQVANPDPAAQDRRRQTEKISAEI
ncbi:TIGR03089 family protein [Mycolicibacterium sediminis]|uniref:TIGR03089 family protein n=1 Tax=Mycolicibacterium sediminis TaxID=1286180 RepID=A0A7I7QQQ2_9MYCO|nr:TIGR03089 family protein [Mycolicibacterium sediminis]BBY28634.1 TIGR03089 family protein [Mycolicibacterium sediminis]